MSFVNAGVQRRLMRELAQMRSDPPEGIRVIQEDDSVVNLIGIIAGPENTPYEGGYFRVKFNFTEEFPAAPPKCRMITKIFHPNVSKAGEICVNTLKKDWKSTYGIAHILVTIKCLLIFPNPESALDEEAGKLLLENYEDYSSRARLITSVHATPKTRPVEFDQPARAAKPLTSGARASPAESTSTVAKSSPPPADTPSPAPATSSIRGTTPPASSENPVTTAAPLSQCGGSSTNATPPPVLQPTNANAPAVSPAAPAMTPAKPTSGVKRPAPPSGMEKRKKALKRL